MLRRWGSGETTFRREATRHLLFSIPDFKLCDRGNVGIIFGLALLPMIGVVGISIDVARTLAARTTLQAAADGAALAAATAAMSTLQAGKDGTTAKYAGAYAGQQMFTADSTKVARWLGAAPTPTVQVNTGAANITAFVSFQTPVPTAFGKIFGVNSYTISGSAASSLSQPKYINISVVADISQSMGLAATADGQSQLATITGGCVFGCHVYQPGQAGTDPYEKQAHDAKVELRIDVISSATQNMIRTASQLAPSKPYITFGLYTLQGGNGTSDSNGSTANGTPFATIATPSSDYPTLLAAATKIDLGNNQGAGIGDTNSQAGMQQLTSAVQASGDGTSGNPQQFIFLLTDGVEDVWAASRTDCPAATQGWNGSHCTLPFDPSWCTSLKTDKKITIGVIYTTYLAIPGDSAYETLVSPFQSQIGPNLQACASPGWYYEASDSTGIQVAINALFARASGSGVLTQ